VRKLSIAVAILLVTAIGAVLAGPSFIDWSDHKDAVAREISDLTGRRLAIEGEVELALLPSPHLRAEKVTLSGIEGGASPHLARAEAIELKVLVGPLLRGQISVESLVLDEPQLVLETLADGRRNWDFSAGRNGDSATSSDGAGILERLRFDQVRVLGGALTYLAPGHAETVVVENALISAPALTGPWQVTADAVWREVRLDAVIGLAGARAAGKRRLRLEVDLPESGTRMEFTGSLAAAEADLALEGRLSVEGDDLQALGDELRPAVLAAPALPSRPFGVNGDLRWRPSSWSLENLAVELGGVGLKGALKGPEAIGGRASLALNAKQLDMERFLEDREGATRLLRLADVEAFGPTAIDMNIQTLRYRGRLVRDVSLRGTLTGTQLEIESLHALLPGGAGANLEGGLTIEKNEPVLRGRARLEADNLRTLLSWVGAELKGVPASRFQQLRLDADLEWRPDLLTLTEFSGRLDVSNLDGALALALRQRPAFGLRLSMDRFDGTAYLGALVAPAKAGMDEDAETESAWWENASRILREFDANIEISIDDLRAGNERVRGFVLDATLQDGKIELRELGAERYLHGEFSYRGRMDVSGETPIIDGYVELSVSDPPAFNRAMGSPSVVLNRLSAFSAQGSMQGSAEDLHLEGVLQEAAGEVAFAGDWGPLSGALSLSLDMGYRDAPSFARLIGVEDALQGIDGPVELVGRLRREEDHWRIDNLEGHIAGIAIAGDVSRSGGSPQDGRWDAEVRLGVLPLSVAGGLLGWAIGSDTAGGLDSLDGAWSRERLALFDDPPEGGGRLSLSAEEVFWENGRLSDVGLVAALEGGKLRVEKLTGLLGEGTLLVNVDAALQDRPEGRFVVTGIDIDPGALVGTLSGLGRPLGNLGINATVTAAGASPRDLVSGLRGRGELRGRLVFPDANAPGIEETVSDLFGEQALRLEPVREAMAVMEESLFRDGAELGAHFLIEEGTVRLSDIRLAGDGAVLLGKSAIDLKHWRMDGRITLFEASNQSEPLVDISVAGRLDEPDLKIEGRALSASSEDP
jgi:hypothetical protein